MDAVATDRVGDRVRPLCGEDAVELRWATVSDAGSLGPVQQAGFCLDRTVPPVKYPGHPEMLGMSEPAREYSPGFPGKQPDRLRASVR